MAINLLTNPTSTPSGDINWTNFVAREDVAGAGGRLMFCSMQLTQRGTTTVPAIAQGGTINVGGSWYQAESDTALTNDTGLSDGTVHIKLVPLGSTLVPTLTNDSMPAWDAEKNGFYDSDDMFLPYEMTKSGSSYTSKFQYAIDVDKTVKIYDDGSASFDGSLDVGGALTVGSGISLSGNITGIGSIGITGNPTMNVRVFSGTVPSSVTVIGSLSGFSGCISTDVQAFYNDGAYTGWHPGYEIVSSNNLPECRIGVSSGGDVSILPNNSGNFIGQSYYAIVIYT